MKPDNQKYFDLLARGFIAIGGLVTLMFAIYFIIDLIKKWY
jgi:hypothetical protein